MASTFGGWDDDDTYQCDEPDDVDLDRPASLTIARFLAYCRERNLRPTYIEEQRITLTRLERDIGPLETATEEAVTGWFSQLEVSPNARGTYCAHAVMFFRWCVRDYVRPDDPTVRLVRPRQRRNLPRPVGETTLARALDNADPRMRAWLTLAAFAGLRAAECASLHADDIHLDTVPPVLIVRDGKGGKQRILPLHPAVIDALAPFASRTGWLFPNRNDPHRHMGSNSVSQAACRYLHRQGIADTFHSFRHRFATSVYRASLDLRMTQELMGHSSPQTTARYCAWAPERAATVVAALTVPSSTTRSFFAASRRNRASC